jgi:hypothetical protein
VGVEQAERGGARDVALGRDLLRVALGGGRRAGLIGDQRLDDAPRPGVADQRDRDRGGDQRDRAGARDQPAAEQRAPRRGEEPGLERRQPGGIERARRGELAAAPQEVARPAHPVPGRGGLLDALAHRVVRRVAREPALQRRPVAEQRLVRDLVRAVLRVVGDDDPAADQDLERGLLGVARRAARYQLGLGPPRPGALRGDQPEQDPAHGVALIAARPGEQPVGVAAQRAADPAERGQRRRADPAGLEIARVPQLGERELEQRQAARRVLGLLDERIDQRLGLEHHALDRGRADDDLADVIAAERAQEVQAARHLVAEPGQRREPRQEVGARGGQHPDVRRADRERGDRGGDRARVVGRGQGQELLELVDEDHQAARRDAGHRVPRELAAQRAGHRVGPLAHDLGERFFVAAAVAGPRRERGGERAHRVAARDDLEARPAVVLGQPRQHAGAAQRRLAGARVAADHDERLDPHPVDQLAGLAGAAEEQRGVGRVERGQPAVRVAVGPGRVGGRRGVLERGDQRVGRREPGARVELDQAIDDRGERRIDAGHDLGEPRDVAALDGVGELLDREPAVRRLAGQQLVEQDAQRVQIGAPGRGLAAPQLGRHVHRRADQLLRDPRTLGDHRARRRDFDRLGRGADQRRPLDRVARRREPAVQGGHRLRGRELAVGAAIEDHRDPEVEQLGLAVLGQDRVGRFDVAVEHAAPVRRGEPARQIERDVEHPLPRHRAVELVERAAADVLGHQVGMAIDLGHPVDRDDVGVLEPRDRPRLLERARPRRRIAGGAHELHRDRAIEHRVVGEVDLPHRTEPERRDDPEFVELGGRLPRHTAGERQHPRWI